MKALGRQVLLFMSSTSERMNVVQVEDWCYACFHLTNMLKTSFARQLFLEKQTK